jgi:hypothetical protein
LDSKKFCEFTHKCKTRLKGLSGSNTLAYISGGLATKKKAKIDNIGFQVLEDEGGRNETGFRSFENGGENIWQKLAGETRPYIRPWVHYNAHIKTILHFVI